MLLDCLNRGCGFVCFTRVWCVWISVSPGKREREGRARFALSSVIVMFVLAFVLSVSNNSARR